MKRILAIAFACAFSAADAQDYDAFFVAQECGLRQSILGMAIDGHTYGKTQEQVRVEVVERFGKYLSAGAKGISDRIIDYGYKSVPRGNSMYLTSQVFELCMENPDQYVGDTYLLDKSKVITQ